MEMGNFCVVYSSVETSFGPMSRDVDGLVQAMRALWDGYMFDLDRSVVPMTYDEEVSSVDHSASMLKNSKTMASVVPLLK